VVVVRQEHQDQTTQQRLQERVALMAVAAEEEVMLGLQRTQQAAPEALAQFALFGRETLAHSHQLVQVTSNETLHSS
jgi:hypothetical protein